MTSLQLKNLETPNPLEEHVKHAVRVFQINKSTPKCQNREEKYLPSLSQWLNKRVYCYIEPTFSLLGKNIIYNAIAGVQDLNGMDIPFDQITFVGKVTGTRTAKVVRDQSTPAEIKVTSEHFSKWHGYAHFILPNREICVLNYELPTK